MKYVSKYIFFLTFSCIFFISIGVVAQDKTLAKDLKELTKRVEVIEKKSKQKVKLFVTLNEIKFFIQKCHIDKRKSRNYEHVCALIDSKGRMWVWDTNDVSAPTLQNKEASQNTVESWCKMLDAQMSNISKLQTGEKSKGYYKKAIASRVLYPASPIQVVTLNCKDNNPIKLKVKSLIYQGVAKVTDGDEESMKSAKDGIEITSTSPHTFIPPQESGPLHLNFSFGKSNTETIQSGVVSYFVEQRYSAAFRLGVGITTSFSDDNVEILKVGENKVLRETHLGPTLELMTLYTPFWFGARKQHNYWKEHYPDKWFAFTFGVGWLAADTNFKNFSILNSINFGPEIAFGNSLSIQALIQIRRGRELQSGFKNGDIVTGDSSDTYSRRALRVGGGVTLSFTPNFFKLRTKATE